MSNIRQLQIANALYASEHAGQYVPILSRNEEGTLTRWLENEDYRALLGIAKEQAWPDELISPNANVLASDGERRFDRSYAMNITGFTGYSDAGNAWQINSYKLENPSDVIAMTDALDWIVSYYGSAKYKGAEESLNSAVAYRYNEKAAVAYYDGHVESHDMSDLSDDIKPWLIPN
ncbi:hypothetical protein [Cerasicoccus arenae]|uniref:Uncharacterized protein n=1 Tax=Cerasicoccus arenae TaxID=424488 RepID=A0A8J3GEF5_9BACT|nr:hypothetical protein [Cerasicoccus arenae]GHC03463.1 hypothetical protein GCM10007047_20070 [Cerasicoccus arenae]